MFSQNQDGRQGVPGMHLQPNMSQQMQIQMNQSQQPGMSQTAMQQDIQQVGMQQPGIQQPGMQQAGMQQAGMQQPGMQQPGMQQSTMQQVGMQQPGMQQPVMQQTGMQQAGMQQASMQQPGMQQPGMQQAGMQQAGMQQAGMQQAGMQQAGMQQASMQQPGMQQPGMQQAGMQQAGMQQAGMQQAGMQQAGMQQASMQQPGMQQAGMQQASMQQPGMQPNVSGMPNIGNVLSGSTQLPRMSSIGQQHSLTGPSIAHQTDMAGTVAVVRPMTISTQHNIKSEVGGMQGANTGVAIQRMPATTSQGGAQPVKPEGPISSLQHHDRIIKFKQLIPQLKECLVDLISIARSNFAANAAIDNREKSVNTSSIPRFDKAFEQFFSICNMIERHLSISHDQLSHSLYSMQYTPVTVNQMRDGNNTNVFSAYIETVQQQLAYGKEIQSLLLETSERIQKRQSMLQPRQSHHQTTTDRPQF